MAIRVGKIREANTGGDPRHYRIAEVEAAIQVEKCREAIRGGAETIQKGGCRDGSKSKDE